MRKLAIAMALASTALATPAVARDKSWYVGIEGGVMLVNDSVIDYNFTGPPARSARDGLAIEYNTGFDIDAIAGYDMGWWRLEGELGYKRASIDNFNVAAPAGTYPINTAAAFSADGHVRVMSAMVNALVDFGDENGLSGYVGVGGGYADVKHSLDLFQTTVTGTPPVTTTVDNSFSDGDGGLAYQVIAGIRTALSPTLDVGLKYRFFHAPNVDFIDNRDASYSTAFRSHSLLASLVYNFAPPPPPPPPVVVAPPPPPPATQTCPDGSVILQTEACPAPAVVQAGPFIVFFDWDKSDITPEAAAILDNAAAAYQQTGKAQVMLAGHADRSGSASYNVGLSQRRADAVRAYLAGRGVADGAMSTAAFGEERPLVQTEDGVREPQNRRVEITFGPGSGM
jgi:outer membrane protein OmpA-like peptidoglycan-associated protein/opacity protein-like surface antigen